MAKLGEVFTIASGGTPDKKKSFYYENGTIPWVKTGDLKTQYVPTGIDCITEEGLNNSPAKLFPPNTVLVAMYGATIGACSILSYEAATNQACAAFLPNENVLPTYLYYFLLSKRDQFVKDGVGGAQPNISAGYLKNVQFDLVPVRQQEVIVERLDEIENLIALRKEQLAKLDQLVKSRFVELFGGYKKTTTIARYISELRGGKSLAGTEPCKNKVLKTGAATFGWFDPEQYKYLPTDYEPLPEHKVETGDVIISRMNTPELVGACSYVFKAPENMYYPDRLWKAVLKENTSPIFLWQLLWDSDVRKEIKESSGGTSGTMHNISKANLLAIRCIDAPIDLQNEFAAFVEQTNKSKVVVQKALDEAQTLFDSLMQEYFG